MNSPPSVRPSVCPIVRSWLSFLRIGSLLFSVVLHKVRGPYGAVRDRAQFFRKNPLLAKMAKNGPKQDF